MAAASIYTLVLKTQTHGTFTYRLVLNEIVAVNNEPLGAGTAVPVRVFLRGVADPIRFELTRDELNDLLVVWGAAHGSSVLPA